MRQAEAALPVWRSGLVTVRPPVEVTLPANLVELADGLARRLEGLEFVVFLEARWQGPCLAVYDWYVPQQECRACSVTVLEDPPARYAGALHRHPIGLTAFSVLDEATFNGNLTFSIVYLPPESFPTAEVYLPLGKGARLAVPARCTVGPPLE
ncbi:MAG: hypothetical protein ACUVTQ_12300, partial [Desulfotomaculales bacterium]